MLETFDYVQDIFTSKGIISAVFFFPFPEVYLSKGFPTTPHKQDSDKIDVSSP